MTAPNPTSLNPTDDRTHVGPLYALKLVDGGGMAATDSGDRDRDTAPLRRGHWSRLSRLWRQGREDDDDDDDPPPAPVSMPPFQPVSGGTLAVAA